MSEHENYNHEEHSSQDGVYSYSYRDINQGDPVGDATRISRISEQFREPERHGISADGTL